MAGQVANKAWAGRDASGVYNQDEPDLPNPTKLEPAGRRIQASIADLISMTLVGLGSAAGIAAGALLAGLGGALAVFAVVSVTLGVLIGLSER